MSKNNILIYNLPIANDLIKNGGGQVVGLEVNKNYKHKIVTFFKYDEQLIKYLKDKHNIIIK